MTLTDWIGFTGVSILLIAYFLNLKNLLKKESIIYLSLNFLGASLACLASIFLQYVPFIILEASWMLVSLLGIYQYFQKLKKI
ncbi:conserved membrane hypothetical protein [Flavobacterium sp. 9AF]|uniref:CBU_0592 family membrane protein n=1 Tax=Flavobacterium sp. 9AF TaxID=2653142 RepID=UPI0012F10335|nr:hypothetical protein [Flavobacterium sp. 9AF]VXC21739.1 conserved membrane hypothetical protein [Flavobacterium sp. 9AF]